VQNLPDELGVEIVGQPGLDVLDVVLQSGDLTGRRRRRRRGWEEKSGRGEGAKTRERGWRRAGQR
jgi:hypothetical protein